MSQKAASLEGVRVLVTRPRQRALELCELLAAAGAQVTCLPVLEFGPPGDIGPLTEAIRQLSRFAWVAFASPAGVEAVHHAVEEAGTLPVLAQRKIAAVGSKTAEAVEALGLRVRLVAKSSSGQGLAADLAEVLEPGAEVFVPQAEEGRPELREALVQAGFRVTAVAAYRAVLPKVDDALLDELSAAPPHVVVFASPRSAKEFLNLRPGWAKAWLGAAKIVAIGSTTEAAIQELGFLVAARAAEASTLGLFQAVVDVAGVGQSKS